MIEGEDGQVNVLVRKC